MKKIKSIIISMMFALFGAAALAATVTKDGVTITYNGGTATTDGEALVLTFTTSTGTAGTQTGSFSFSGTATADILVVGGGGSGGRSNNNGSYYGSGSGGTVKENTSVSLGGGTYTVSVGNGGAAITSNGNQGKDGVKSSISGSFPSLSSSTIESAGGAGGGTSAAAGSGSGTLSVITGDTYGTGGVKATGSGNRGISGGANTGDGGTGSNKGNNSGAGGSGIVVVRITAIQPLSVDFQGQTIIYSGGTYAWDGDELVFTFTEDGSLDLPVNTTVDYLVVGGGGGGGKGSNSSTASYRGSSGNGGEVRTADDVTFTSGTYTVDVGEGGPAATSNSTKGGDGQPSSIAGGQSITAQGGAGGAGSGNEAGSAGPGAFDQYGKGGATPAANGSAGDEPGEGGQGSRGGGSYSPGAGGDGIVIVRVKSMLPQVSRTADAYVGTSMTLSNIDGTVASVKSSDTSKATVTKNGNTVTVTGVAVGETTVTVTTDTTVYTYTVTVKDRQEISPTVDLAKGPDSATSYTYTFDSIESITGVDANIIDYSRDGNTITFTAKAAGTNAVVVTGVLDGIPTLVNYTVRVTEKQKDVKPVGDGYVTYDGASDVFYDTDGNLILVFDDPEAAGSFEVPAPFTAKIDVLAVGGGGAGGTEAAGKGQGGGGGGAGGYSYKQNVTLEVGTYNVSVGAGGKVHQYDDYLTGITGGNGQASSITNSFGYAFVSAKGGGGGGATVAEGNNGSSGGSGGGAAWYNRKAGMGGAGTDGQGYAGGTPTSYSNGGAGGGASGKGGDWNQAGAGTANDITGESVIYAAGGKGGQGSSTAAATAGEGPGFGGDGGNGGLGANNGLAGSGGDGVVIVRVTDVSKSVKVPLPTVDDILRTRYEWADGASYSGLEYDGETFTAADGRIYNWSDAISYVSGVTNVDCSVVGTNKVGIGYYNFTIYLKDGFVWDTEPDKEDSYGSTDGQSHRWRIVENLENVDAEINVKKSVVNQNGSNATVRVESFSSPEISGGGTPNVLFLGTRCQAHDLTTQVITDSINAALESANVDWYIYDKGKTTPVYQGRNLKGDVIPNTFAIAGSVHSTLNEFYTHMYNVATSADATKYDYIVMEFDGSRIACDYAMSSNWTIDKEKTVAQWLAPYYESDSVVWIVDNCYCGSSSASKDREPFGGEQYWRPNSAEFGNAQHAYPQMLSDVKYRGLVGMFDPTFYLQVNPTANTSAETLSVASAKWTTTYYNESGTSKTASTSSPVYFYAANRYDTQVYYDNAKACAELLRATIKVKPYNLDTKDKIVDPGEGLLTQTVTIQVCTNGVDGVASDNPSDWVDLMSWNRSNPDTFTYLDTECESGIPGGWLAVNTNNNEVTACFSNVDFQVWSKLDIGVVDTGKFRTSKDATYNNITGQWEKNPNEGQAQVEMTDVATGDGIGVEGRADTSIPMKFEAYKVIGTAVNGYIYVSGNADGEELFISEGSTVPVVYRGKGGYTLVSVTVDGTVWGRGAADTAHQDISAAMTNYCNFVNIAANHEVHVVYEQYAGGVTSSPVTNAYDGAAHLIDVSLDGDWNSPYEVEIRYTLTPDADLDDYMTEEDFLEYCRANDLAKDVEGSGAQGYEIFYEVFAKQPGYGADMEPGWVWVETGVGGSNYSVITPQTLIVKPDRAKVIAFGDPFPETDYTVTGFIEGEDISVVDTTGWHVAPDDYVQGVSGEGQYKTHMVGVDQEDVHDANYIIIVEPGLLDVVKTAMEIGDVPQGPHLNPEDPNQDTGVDPVIRVYDGTPTNITVEVTYPADRSEYKVLYSVAGEDGNPTTWYPIETVSDMINVGSNKVWYAVDPVGEAVNRYFNVTNYSYVVTLPRPVTVQAASATKAYDGTALTTNGYVVVSGDLAQGDGISAVSITGSQTDVGSSTNVLNSITITNGKGETVNPNYTITLLNGKLTVTPAPIHVGDVPQSLDPLMPNDYGDTGVEDVTIVYDGTGTNIVVNVTKPLPDDPGVTDIIVRYSTDRNGTYSDTIAFTNVGVYQVWFTVDVPGTGYVSVSNVYAYVTILPREIVVTADDKSKAFGAQDPELTWTVTDGTNGQGVVVGILPGEEGLVHTAVSNDLSIARTPGEEVTPAGQPGYPITPSGSETLGNYHVRYVPGELLIFPFEKPEPLIAEFTLSVDNGTLQTMRIWAPNVKEGDTIYLAGAATFDDARAGNWTPLANSSNTVSDLSVFGADHICAYPDIPFTAAEKAENYRFFRPYILTKDGPVAEGRKYVGIVDVPMDFYGETAAGVPFVRCLSETPDEEIFEELRPYAADIPLTELVQTNTLHGSSDAFSADKYYTLAASGEEVVNWYYLAADGTWTGIPDAATAAMPAPAASSVLVRGTGFTITRESVAAVTNGLIRLHGQVSETPVEWPAAADNLVMLSNGLPEDFDLNDKVYGVPGNAGASVTYMDDDDYTYVISFEDGTGWYRTKTMISKGKRTTTKVAPPVIPAGRVFWFKSGASPATPVTGK